VTEELREAVERSDGKRASEIWEETVKRGVDSWEIHLGLFPVAQRVLNPPFINPHLPKMYRIDRELAAYLKTEEIPALIRIEVNEFATRPKLETIPRGNPLPSRVPFEDIEAAIREDDRMKTAVSMSTFCEQKGVGEFARRLLLLGSGYLDDSLGHSVSCTAFILLEMMERKDQDPWPALATLADYFCKGQFHTTPPFREPPAISSDEIDRHMLRAASGRGIINLHHTITRYAIERVRHLFGEGEYRHLLDAWIAFIGEKKEESVEVGRSTPELSEDYRRFYGIFSRLDAKAVVASLREMLGSEQGRRQLGRVLVRGVCDQYQGHYNPHYLTGLGSALWVVDQYGNHPPVAINALYQYVDFFFTGLKS